MVAKLRTGITKAVQSVPAEATRSMSLIFDARRAFRRFTFFVKILPQKRPFYDLNKGTKGHVFYTNYNITQSVMEYRDTKMQLSFYNQIKFHP